METEGSDGRVEPERLRIQDGQERSRRGCGPGWTGMEPERMGTRMDRNGAGEDVVPGWTGVEPGGYGIKRIGVVMQDMGQEREKQEADMEEKKKVVFVVYRTEWWGCLEGYCRQECRREDTICYVMPIPRYERDDITYKANFDKVHFQPEKIASELPEGACLVDWQNFSLEQGFERIYIHNPYENGSLVDTVELKYYASSLKQHTKKLIYVSHFMNLIPEDYANCKAYDYVDAIYVPYEKARFSLDVKYDRKVEVVPSGLPAYLDRLAKRLGSGHQEAESACRETESTQRGRDRGQSKREQHVAVPHTDSRRKLLYCVSYIDLYHGTEKQLRKMREVFDYVKRNPDIQLIFRPDEDIRARRGMLDEKIWKGYEQLVADFKKNHIGIYDESTDLYEAAVEADGIMSRNHPMNDLFSVQGKYILQVDFVQRQAAPSREERCTPAVWDAAVTERDGEIELLFVPNGTRLICRMMIPGGNDPGADTGTAGRKYADTNVKNAKTMAASVKKKGKKHLSGPKVEVLAEVPDEIIGGLNYMFLSRQGDCLYLLPCASDGIWKYNMSSQYFGKAYLPDAVPGPVSAVFRYGRYLYMAPSVYPGIVKYDTETEEITIIDGWVREMESMVSGEYEKDPYFFWAAVQEGQMLYMASSKGDIWMEFDMAEDTWQLRTMDLPGKRFLHMVKDGEWVWLLPYLGDEIVLWNCVSGQGNVIYVSGNPNRDSGLVPYLFAVDLGEAVAAFPQRETDHVLVISKKAVFSRQQADPMSAVSKGNGTAGMQGQKEPEPGLSGGCMTVRLLEEKEVRKLREGIPCGPGACQSEYRKRLGCGYQFVKRLESGLILAYEYYEGSFLLLDGKLNLIRRIPCRLPIETVRQQQDVMWRNAQARNGYSGRIFEGGSIPVMLENFVRHGREDREKVREYYRKYSKIKLS